jgi:CelD/BcsL family acetyltransferase involved in cellulose biosynthesis
MKTQMPVSISVYRQFQDARPVWRRYESDGLHYAFQTHDWLSCWQRHVGELAGLSPVLVAVDDIRVGRLMFLPLAIQRRLGSRCLTWLGGRHADYHAPLLGAGYPSLNGALDMASLWRRILDHLPPVDVIHLEKQPADILGIRNPFVDLAMPVGVSAHAAHLMSDWQSYLGSRRGAKSRATDRRKMRRLQEKGQVTIRLDLPAAEVAAVMPRLIALKRCQLARVGGKDPFDGPGYSAFYEALAAQRHENLRVMVSTLAVDDEIVAAHWGVVAGKRFYWLVPVYDEAWRTFSPGLHLMQALMEWCFGNGIEVFDFTVGDEDYKETWCDTLMPLYHTLSLAGARGLGAVGAVQQHRVARLLSQHIPILSRLKKEWRRSVIAR